MTTRKKDALKAVKKTVDTKTTAVQAINETAAGTEETGAAQTDGFSIVGTGASAGNLSNFDAFLSGMPAGVDPNMAFVAAFRSGQRTG
ncbi:MAG: hypothetical protein PHO08_14375 [Methylococcales bacterium]|nr:hypothetical protein [Methylococcales bacterium]MDD5632401.1 hypothetical protein [Methylococcales bacterium]